MDYSFIKELITLAGVYEQEKGDTPPSSTDFACWLLNNTPVPRLPDERVGPALAHYETSIEKTETTIARMVTYLYRYARGYTKKALEGSPLQSADEFGYLATLLSFDQLRKSELIAKNIHEKPTGTEIINRLLKQGLIEQLDDPTDKRSKLVRITPQGKGVIFAAFARLGRVSDLIGGELSAHEKQHLLHLLQKLDNFHYHLFTHQKQETLDSLVR